VSTEIKLGIIAVIVIALALGGYLGYRSAYDSGLTAGKAEIQAAWDTDKAKIQAVTDAAIAQATKDKEDAIAANEAIQNDYQTQLSAARTLSDALAQRLRSYTASHPANSGAVSKAGSGSEPAATSSQAGDVILTNALGAALAECSANTAQLDALIVEIKRQL